jgi:hypothetical protein
VKLNLHDDNLLVLQRLLSAIFFFPGVRYKSMKGFFGGRLERNVCFLFQISESILSIHFSSLRQRTILAYKSKTEIHQRMNFCWPVLSEPIFQAHHLVRSYQNERKFYRGKTRKVYIIRHKKKNSYSPYLNLFCSGSVIYSKPWDA